MGSCAIRAKVVISSGGRPSAVQVLLLGCESLTLGRGDFHENGLRLSVPVIKRGSEVVRRGAVLKATNEGVCEGGVKGQHVALCWFQRYPSLRHKCSVRSVLVI